MSKKGSPVGQKKGYDFQKPLGKLTIELEGVNPAEYDVPILPKNHLRQGGIYKDFCVLNQEFLKYILYKKLTISEYRILFFLLSYMDMDNKIIIDSEMIEHNLGINKTHVNKYIRKLDEKKIIYKRNLGYKKGQEVLINFDVISPHLAFKNKNNRENVSMHKINMSKDVPYIRQHNAFTGKVDLIDQDTGEVFNETSK